MTTHIPTVIDLFSGPGGTGYGFKEAGFHILSAVELDQDAAKTYKENLGVSPKVVDIRELKPDIFRREIGIAKSELDVLVGCPPCQGFTRMRNNSGSSDKRNDLVLTYLEFIREFQPKFVLFENVPGLIRTAHGKIYYTSLINGLEALNYHFEQFLINAADYGVAQKRRRVIVIASKEKHEIKFPKATHGNPRSREVQKGSVKRWWTVTDEIKRFPTLKSGESSSDFPNHFTRDLGETVLMFISHVPKDGGSRTDVPKELWLTCHQKHSGHKDVYGRMQWSAPSNVITSGCTNVSKGRFVHPEQDRGISPREAAALQGFPDTYKFFGGMDSISRQIGNAVPPPLAKVIAEMLKREL